MNEEQKMQVAKLVTPEEQTKIDAWGKFGSQLYRTEITLQLQAQEIATKLIDPITSALIADAEQAYATVKKEYGELQKRRIAVTSKFDPVITRLSSHEKTLLKSLQDNAQAILKAKQVLKEAVKTKEAKEKELKDIEKQVLVYVADMHAAYLAAQLKTLSDAYEYALANNITIEALPEFKAKVCARVNINNRITPPPKPIAQYNTQEAVDAEVLKHFNPWPPIDYVNGFTADVELKFSDWQQALQDKPAAKELNQKEVSTTTAAIDDQLQKQKISAGLNALAVPLVEFEDSKPLKEVWKITEPVTPDEIFAIINAFAVNRNLVQDAVTKIKPLNFSIKQMIAALIKVKTEDESFECTGIIFTKIDKL